MSARNSGLVVLAHLYWLDTGCLGNTVSRFRIDVFLFQSLITAQKYPNQSFRSQLNSNSNLTLFIRDLCPTTIRIMQKRTNESPMDFEWQTRAPGDVTSPFYQLAMKHENENENKKRESNYLPQHLYQGFGFTDKYKAPTAYSTLRRSSLLRLSGSRIQPRSSSPNRPPPNQPPCSQVLLPSQLPANSMAIWTSHPVPKLLRRMPIQRPPRSPSQRKQSGIPYSTCTVDSHLALVAESFREPKIFQTS